MGNSESKFTPLSQGFHLFPQLPIELQAMIWKTAADDWIDSHLSSSWHWTTPSGKRVSLLYIDVEHRNTSKRDSYRDYACVLKFPDLLFAARDSRSTMYDALLGAGMKAGEIVPRGEDVCLFLKLAKGGKDYFTKPQQYGWRVQDFRYPALERRVNEEEERLRELGEEIEETAENISRHRERAVELRSLAREGKACQYEGRSEGYIRLPLFNETWGNYTANNGTTMSYLYPKIPGIQIRDLRVEA